DDAHGCEPLLGGCLEVLLDAARGVDRLTDVDATLSGAMAVDHIDDGPVAVAGSACAPDARRLLVERQALGTRGRHTSCSGRGPSRRGTSLVSARACAARARRDPRRACRPAAGSR